jgi:hypothetical protein
MTTLPIPPACLMCRHLYPEGRVCRAYNTRPIPVEIWTSEETHYELRGDEDTPVFFEPIPDAED